MRLFSGIAGTLNGRQAEEVTQYNCYTTERPKGYINRDCLPSSTHLQSRYTS